MPQLNPAPWFMILILIWMLLIMLLTKILNNKPPLNTSQYWKQSDEAHWTWP
uniref:ATP synthase F0 subunit 8 n=1 Tax=Lacerta bilineata TaxID=95620 RepID=UPI000716CDF8|nr:ATP synthase F0 subunit 8 [Lacerta bilineata]